MTTLANLSRAATWWLCFSLPAQAAAPEAESLQGRTLRALEQRAAQQTAAIQKVQAFHAFRFVDRQKESQIDFEHHIVDDAGKDYKAAHYDHGNGLAVADIDGDGRLDVYFTTQRGENQLWRNLGGGKFENVTDRAGVGLPDQISVAASFGDIDNDGDPDLFVTTVRHGNHLFRNEGNGRFRDVTREAGLEYSGHSSAAVFFDFNRDGRLDLLVVNVGVYTTSQVGPGGYYVARPDAFYGHIYPERTEYSLLYRNLDGSRFEEVSESLHFREGSWSGDATIADLNQDGWPDLYVLNMQGDDHYYENQAGQGFVDKTSAYFPKTPWGAMGIKFFDFNQDGRMDLLVTDMHSDMTKDHTERALGFQLQTEKSKSEAFCSIQWTEAYLQGSSNNIFGNAFYERQANGTFAEESDRLNAETYWPWGVSVGDLNADGFEDVFVTAGMGYPFRYGINSLLLNDAGTRFADAEFVLGIEPRAGHRTQKPWFVLDCDGTDKRHPLCQGRSGKQTVMGTLSSRSSAIFDLDDDGDLDIVSNDFNDRPQILISDLTQQKPVHFLKIKLHGRSSNRDGLGAMVRVHARTGTFGQLSDGKSGYLSQSSLPLYFGLGDAVKAEWVEVVWPAGKTQRITDSIPANGLLEIIETE
ncbi:MAG: CRTAC1 family protein [Verrucomicrobiota bacterium]